METEETIAARSGRVQAALRDAFGIRSKTLDAAVRRAGRRLPKRLQAEAQHLIAAQAMGGHPKRVRRVDSRTLDSAEERLVTFLDGIDRADLRKGRWLGIAGAIVFNLLLVLAGVVVWMVWAGHV